jgi:hypothetical protein
MASAAPPNSLFTFERAKRYLKLAVGGLLTALLGGLLAAWFTYVFTSRLNHEAAVQQQYLASVQDFVSSGARVDASVTGLADGVLDDDAVKEERREARQAIAAHVAATQSLSQVIGTGNAHAYMQGLATLRTLVDRTSDDQSALRASRARFEVMENRSIIVAEARRRIFGKPEDL